MSTVECPDCGHLMHNCGNVEGRVMLTSPPKHYDTYVCFKCKNKKKVLVTALIPDWSFLSDYREL